MKVAHRGLGVEIDLPEMTQGQVEAFFRHAREGGIDPMNLSGPEYAGAVVRAAQSVGWFDLGPVEGLKPAVVIWAAGRVNTAVAEALAVPPE